jgi:putative cell wall-binding protein
MSEPIKRLFSTRIFGAIGLVIAMAVMSACASTPPVAPTAELANARDAITSAEQDGARQHAGSQLDEAKQKLMRAEESVSNEKMIQAKRFAQEAVMAAELASARTESAKAVAINEEMERSAEALDEEMRRTGGQQ